ANRSGPQLAAWLFEELAALDHAGLHGTHHHGNALVEALARLALVDAHAFVLPARQSAAEADESPPARHVIEQQDLLGHAHRIVPGYDQHLRAEAHARVPPGEVGVVHERIRADGVVAEVVLGDPDGLKPELCGELELTELLAHELPVVDARMIGKSAGD